MIYKTFKGIALSALGMGCMRFPLNGADQIDVDLEATEAMVDYAIKNGINYFDTAWPYHGGISETIIGGLLKKYPRNSFFLASKFPGFKEETMSDPRAVFEKQLEKCNVAYFDFYLCHNVCERNIGWLTEGKYQVVEYLIQQKKAGRIRHLGFSTHGSRAVIRKFLDIYGEHIEFCQIQLNYLDWDLQSAKEKVALLNDYKIPIWVMEPVRGGKLAKLDEKFTAQLEQLRPGVSAPEWAFRFLQDIDGVSVILSGMSDMEQLRENIAIFAEEKPLNEKERAALLCIADNMICANQIPCTGCAYCLERCPKNLPIPALIKAFNENTISNTPAAAACIGCRNCEAVCPQGIKISEILARLV